MYQYTEFDRQFVHQRAAQFRDQLTRNLGGTLSDDEFRPLRLQNGWYVQRHAPMLRIAVPYGELSSKQMRQLARIAREYDRGYGHFTTRQNVQFNWIPLPKAADVMDLLAEVNMHGIQTSGNCIRNITADAMVGVAEDEIIDARPYCEVLRQWWQARVGDADLPQVDNGAGLSRDARLTAQALARMLQVAWLSPVMPELVASLPITGVDGTLRRSQSRAGTAHLKTGSLRDVMAVAGYVHAASGRRYVLVAVVNHPNAGAARPVLDSLIDWTAREQ